MKSSVTKDKKYRKIIKNKEMQYFLYKTLKHEIRLPIPLHQIINAKFQKKYKLHKIGTTRVHNYCTVSGRAKSVYRFFRTSRMVLKKMATLGYYSGVKKSSW